jgi:hypothetical protein
MRINSLRLPSAPRKNTPAGHHRFSLVQLNFTAALLNWKSIRAHLKTGMGIVTVQCGYDLLIRNRW